MLGLGYPILLLGLCCSISCSDDDPAAQGNPHISYLDATNHDLKYAAKSGGSWTLEIVDATGVVGAHTSLVLDAQGNPHISYWDGTNGDLKYAAKSGGSWTLETVDAPADVGLYTSLVLR